MIQTSQKQQHRITALILVVVLLILTACLGGGGGDEAPVEVVAGQQYQVACNNTCAARGQCGTRAGDNAEVVLISSLAPVVDGHDISVDIGAKADLVETQSRPVRTIASGEQFDLPFHYMFFPDYGFAGWVAGWCVEPLQQ